MLKKYQERSSDLALVRAHVSARTNAHTHTTHDSLRVRTYAHGVHLSYTNLPSHTNLPRAPGFAPLN